MEQKIYFSDYEEAKEYLLNKPIAFNLDYLNAVNLIGKLEGRKKIDDYVRKSHMQEVIQNANTIRQSECPLPRP